ncbi:MAG: PilZ domain-containing protein [Granulosicoccus sp.]
MNDITIDAAVTGRDAYRVVQDPNDPIILQLDGNLSRVLDISASGFSAPPDVVPAGRRYAFSLDLPTATRPLAGYVDVLPQSPNGHLHCKFVDLSTEDLDTLHHYVLIRQKEAIRSIRAGKAG